RDLSLLTSTGSAICGAAAVLGAEPVVKGEPHKTAVAVSTVVIFGTLSMFIYPVLYRVGLFDLTPEQMGLYTGATLHEVAHVVGAGNAMGTEIADPAIIVKMIRVMLLAPVLVIMGFALARGVKAVPATATPVGSPEKTNLSVKPNAEAMSGIDYAEARKGALKRKITIPWFAFGFLLVIGINSLLPQGLVWLDTLVNGINQLDTFMLTMAMTALGAETSFDKFKKAGFKPFLLAFILYIWLMGGGYLLAKYLA
ncbi:MAG: putative sulfate exporter family transporter, partial [Bacteroidales bacterium]|nr:putative sulfate exporter family transporter [Bacteroidales bacterium]